MSNPTAVTVEEAAQSGALPPAQFYDAPERVKEIANEPLIAPNLNSAIDSVTSAGFYDRSSVEEAVISLMLGHVLLGGPPGTGKTFLARLLAKAFQVHLIEETANPEWSVYDVIGTQALTPEGGARPRHGIVTTAILQCASAIVRSADTGDPPFATWLLIDEFNRSEIDRAFGPLFTALSGDSGGTYTLDYVESQPIITVPDRFRIIGTMNDYDTRFVNSMSAALRRRFKRTLIVPPDNQDGRIPEREFEVAVVSAVESLKKRIIAVDADNGLKLLRDHSPYIRESFGAIRSLDDHGGVPVGTAQLIDCCIYAMAALAVIPYPSNEVQFKMMWDSTLATQLVNGLESDSTRLRIDENYVTAFGARFPDLTRTTARLRRFVSGSE